MRRVVLATLLPVLIAQGAFAAPPALAPGKPAGIKQAQEQEALVPLAVFGAAAVGIGIALAVSDNSDGTTATPPATTTTTTTGTAP